MPRKEIKNKFEYIKEERQIKTVVYLDQIKDEKYFNQGLCAWFLNNTGISIGIDHNLSKEETEKNKQLVRAKNQFFTENQLRDYPIANFMSFSITPLDFNKIFYPLVDENNIIKDNSSNKYQIDTIVINKDGVKKDVTKVDENNKISNSIPYELKYFDIDFFINKKIAGFQPYPINFLKYDYIEYNSDDYYKIKVKIKPIDDGVLEPELEFKTRVNIK